MKIASWNIWNSETGMPHRRRQILDAIRALDADVLCLQELADETIASALGDLYPYRHKNGGAALFSRAEMTAVYEYPYAAAAMLAYGEKKVFAVSLHLPWYSARRREEAIVEIAAQTHKRKAQHSFLCGDFNCSPASAVQRFLLGDQSLLGKDAMYFDLAESYAALSRIPAAATLDFRSNPRWRDENGAPNNSIEVNQRFDRILLRNPYPRPFPTLWEAGIFGTEIDAVSGYAPSDHYGVYAVLTL